MSNQIIAVDDKVLIRNQKRFGRNGMRETAIRLCRIGDDFRMYPEFAELVISGNFKWIVKMNGKEVVNVLDYIALDGDDPESDAAHIKRIVDHWKGN